MRMMQFNHFGNDTCNRNTCMLKLNFLIFFLLKIVYAKIALQLYKFLILFRQQFLESIVHFLNLQITS